MGTTEPRRAVGRLFRDAWGYDIPREEERMIRASRGSATYGEMRPSGVDRLIDELGLGADDVFYDLGSGVGKVVVQVAMAVPIRRCVGIELSRSRHVAASVALRRAREQGLIRARACKFVNQDLLDARVADATVLYSCSTAFSLQFMRDLTRKLAGLRRGVRFVTTQPLFTFYGFRETDDFRVDMTWKRRSSVYVYELDRPRA